jgi:hypothetical protein
MDRETRRLAVLIDAENAQLAVLAGLLAEIAKLGLATMKCVYGDFTSPLLASWRERKPAQFNLPAHAETDSCKRVL